MKLISCVAYYRLVSQCNATEIIADYYSLVYNQIHMVRMYMLLFFFFLFCLKSPTVVAALEVKKITFLPGMPFRHLETCLA